MRMSLANFAANLRRFCEKRDPRQPVWVGLAGCPGSGKSTVAEMVMQECPGSVCVVPMDGYHFSKRVLDQMDDPQTAHARRGAPFTFDAHRFIGDLLEAKSTGRGQFPAFEHATADPVEDAIKFDANQAAVVLVEGNYLLLDTPPWNLLPSEVFDLTCWLDVPVDECCQRIHQRNMDLGMTKQQSEQKVESNDRPNANLVSENGARLADWILL